MKKYLVLVLPVLLFGQQSLAAYVANCDDANFGVASIVAGSEATYYNGKVAAYLVDKEEPAASPVGVAINFPVEGDGGEPGYMACKAVAGLAGVNWEKKASTYDSDKGLLIEVPATQYNHETSDFDPVVLKIRINLAKGSVTLE